MLMTGLRSILGDPSALERCRADAEAARVQLEQERLALDKARHVLECAMLQQQLVLKEIEVKKATLLTRIQLLQSGVSREEVDLVFPLPMALD